MRKVIQSGLIVFPDILVAIFLISILRNSDYALYITYLSAANLILLLSGIINPKIISGEVLKRTFVAGVVAANIIIFFISFRIASDLSFNLHLYYLFLLNSILIIFSNILDAFGTRGGYLEKLFIGQYLSGVIKIILCTWLLKFGYESLFIIIAMISLANFVQALAKLIIFMKNHQQLKGSIISKSDNSIWFFINPFGVNLFFGLDIILLNYLKIDVNTIAVFARCKQLISIIRQFANILISLESSKIADFLSVKNFDGMQVIVDGYKKKFAMVIIGFIFTSIIFNVIGFWSFDTTVLILISFFLLLNWKNRLNTQLILINGQYIGFSTLGLIIGGSIYLLLLFILAPSDVLQCILFFFIGIYLKSLIDALLVWKMKNE